MIKEKYITRTKETSLNIVQTEIESIRKKDITKTGLRIYKDGFIGVAGALGSYDEKELEAQAIEALDLKIEYPYEISCENNQEINMVTEFIKEDNFINEIEEMLKELRKQNPLFSFSNKINLIEQEVSLKNDKNLNLIYNDKILEIVLIIKHKDSNNIFDAFAFNVGRKYDRNEFIKITTEICNAYNNIVEVPKKTSMPIIFNSSDFLIKKKFAEDLNGLKFGSSGSIFSNKLGEKLFNDNFTLYQSSNPEDTFSAFFDAEGVVNKNYRYDFIKNGTIVSPYSDKKCAKMFNLPITGSASSSYDGVPSLNFQNLTIEESNKTVKELLNGEMGILIKIAEGGDFTPDGTFGTPVQLAFLFDGEKLIGRLPQFQISSNVFEMFGANFRGVSKDSINNLSNDKFVVIDFNLGTN